MADETFDRGALRVAYPETFEPPRDLSADRSRSLGTDPMDLDDPATLIINNLGGQYFTSVRPLELTSPPASGGPRVLAQPVTWKVDVDVDADESAVVLVDHDGVLSWQAPARRTHRRGSATRSAGVERPATLTFDLIVGGSEPAVGEPTRSFNLTGAVGRVRIYLLRFGAGVVTGLAIKHLEQDIQQGLVTMTSADPKQWRLVPNLTDISLSKDKAARILLFVHGTFSSTLGSYASLAATDEGRAFLDNAISSYDAVIGFDHPTLSCDPMENATDLLNRLSAATLAAPPTIDIVCYSRGGLVARSLVEGLLPSATWRAIAGRIVFVGAPNGGTSIVEPENWARFLDLYTNLALASARVVGLIAGRLPIGEIAAASIKGAAVLAKYLVAYGVNGGGVPGLAAMRPQGEFLRNLNETQPGQPEPGAPWYVISSEFEPSKVSDNVGALSAELKRRMIAGFAGQLFGVPNDLVVDTASMGAIDPAVGGFVAGSLPLPPNGEVYHLTYFVQPPVARALKTWLVDAIQNVPVGSVVTLDRPWQAERKIAVFDADAIVRNVRRRLEAGPSMVVIRNMGGSFDRAGTGLAGNAIGDSTGSFVGGIDFYPINLETASNAVDEADDDLTISDVLGVGALRPAPTVDIADLAPDWFDAANNRLPGGVVITDGSKPVGVIPDSVIARAIDELVKRRPQVDTEVTATDPEPAEPQPRKPEPPRVRLTAQMPERLKQLDPFAVTCTLSRDGTVVIAGGKQKVFQPRDPRRDIVIRLITVSNAKVVGDDYFSYPTPATGEVKPFSFEVIPTQLGSCEVWVVASQGEEQLVTLILQAVVEAEVTVNPKTPGVEASVPIGTGEETAGSQQLVIWEKTDGTKVSYEYHMVNEDLDIRVHGTSPADLGDRKDFFAGIYTVLENAQTAADEDADDLLADLQDLGSDLFSRVLPLSLQRELWKNRDNLTRLVVRPNEAYVPWELIHLKDPDGDGSRPDEPMFLAQLGLVRWLNAQNATYPPKILHNKRVRKLCARYQDKKTKTLPAIDKEEEFLDHTFKAVEVDPTKKAVRTLLKSGDFDIFHFAGHGLARQTGLKDTVIQLGDVPKPDGNGYRPIMVNDKAVRENAVLDKARTGGPLVFLNACQAGRSTVQLGSMGGFAQAFLSRGAGAFISTLWSVGDELARTFGEEFYRALLSGEEVSAAVRLARKKGSESPNFSWLAYVVYANPAAKFDGL